MTSIKQSAKRGKLDSNSHRDSKRKHVVVVFSGGVIRNHHSVGDDHPGAIGRAWEESHRVARVHDEGLLLGHGVQVVKHEPELQKNVVGIAKQFHQASICMFVVFDWGSICTFYCF